uniref:protein PF3D7_1417600-like n=1 Tax=Vespula vulgaris TaxID=7454 RepID=UPI00212C6265|nr:protein PF3D7_1417600-like [Vespula vulgaris]XP_050855016.1 protein PF3D7_1417600-like [Vespula vulgaris]
MESQNRTLQNTSKTQQVTVISKLHNMQWLKNNTLLPGHVKSRTLKKSINNLREDLETVKFVRTSINNNLELANTTNIVLTKHDNKYDSDIESDITERSVVSKNIISTLQLKKKINSSYLNKQTLVLKELKKEEIMNMATNDSLITEQLEIQLRLEEQEKDKCNALCIASEDTKQNTPECNLLVSLEVQDKINKINQTNVHDKNNNDKLNTIKQSNSKSDIETTTLLIKDDDQEVRSNNISLSQEKHSSINSKNLDKTYITKKDTRATNLSKTSNVACKSQKTHEHQIEQPLKEKETQKIVPNKSAFINVPNKSKNEISKQNIDIKFKNGIKNSLKNEPVVISKKFQDKKDYQPNQSILNTSKELKSKCNLQSKKESNIKPSSESISRYTNKNVKESEEKTTPSNSINKQTKLNRACYSYKKAENKSISKVYNNSSKTTQCTVKEKKNDSNSSSLVQLQTTAQLFNVQEKHSGPSKKVITSHADNKYENIAQNTILKGEQAIEIPILKEQCIDECINDKLVFNTVNKEINAFFKEVEETNESIIPNLPNKHSINECIEQKPIYTNPSLQDSSNLQTNIKESVHNDFCDSNRQFDNISSNNTWYAYEHSQENIYQQQTPSHQNFIHSVPNQFITGCPVNTTLPKYNSNVSHSDANAIHLNQYDNIPIMQNNSLNTSSMSNPNVLHTSTKNTNMLQYQMPNIVPCSNPNMIRPQPGFCVHPMTAQEEQFNLHRYGMSYSYFMNSCFVCRNEHYLPHSQNWNLPNTYPVSLLPNSHLCNCNLCCNHSPSNDMMYKNPAIARSIPTSMQAETSYEQNLQRNGRPMSNSWYNDRSSHSNETYGINLQTQGVIVQEKIDSKQEKKDCEFLSDKEITNLPIISPRACMNYEGGLPININTVRPQTKYSRRKESGPNYDFPYKKYNERSYISKEYMSNAKSDYGKKAIKQQSHPNYKA